MRHSIAIVGLVAISLAIGFLAGALASRGELRAVITRYPSGKVEYVTPLDYCGRPHGKEIGYFESGAVKSEYIYESGVAVSYVQYYESGRRKVTMSEAADHTVSISYYEDH